MAKMTTLDKVNAKFAALLKVENELQSFETISKLTDNKEVKAKLAAFENRCKEDVDYLTKSIRGFVAREVPLNKLMSLSKELFS